MLPNVASPRRRLLNPERSCGFRRGWMSDSVLFKAIQTSIQGTTTTTLRRTCSSKTRSDQRRRPRPGAWVPEITSIFVESLCSSATITLLLRKACTVQGSQRNAREHRSVPKIHENLPEIRPRRSDSTMADFEPVALIRALRTSL